jgi:hypothetical protein
MNITTGSAFLDGVINILIYLFVFSLIIIIPVWLLGRAAKKERSVENKLLKGAAPGEAKIIEVGGSRTGQSDQKMHVALRLEVTPQFGEQFTAITSWVVEPAHMVEIQTGKSMPIKVVGMIAKKSKKKFNSIFPAVG